MQQLRGNVEKYLKQDDLINLIKFCHPFQLCICNYFASLVLEIFQLMKVLETIIPGFFSIKWC